MLIIDATTNQKARYVVPVINPTTMYVTEYEEIDIAVGFSNIEDIKRYLGLSEEQNLEYIKLNRKKILEPFEVHNAKYREVDLSESIGEICKDFIVPYPPGIPIVLPGEEITQEVIDAIMWYQRKSISILGVRCNSIKIVLVE